MYELMRICVNESMFFLIYSFAHLPLKILMAWILSPLSAPNPPWFEIYLIVNPP